MDMPGVVSSCALELGMVELGGTLDDGWDVCAVVDTISCIESCQNVTQKPLWYPMILTSIVHFFFTHPFFLRPGPPKRRISLQYMQLPQSVARHPSHCPHLFLFAKEFIQMEHMCSGTL